MSGSNTKELMRKMINDEYKVWKKNAPFLYDCILSHALEWPSITVDWCPQKHSHKEKNLEFMTQRLILGTHTDGEQNHLLFAEVKLPSVKTVSPDDRGGHGRASGKFQIVQSIKHPGEVQRARHMPQNMNIIATRPPSNDVLVWDRTKHPSVPLKDSKVEPDLRLQGHTASGYGVDWSPQTMGHLLTSDDDSLICQWDISKLSKQTFSIQPLCTYRGHNDVVEDVAWHPMKSTVFASVDDDACIMMWDSRTCEKPTIIISKAHRGEINCIDWNKYCEYLYITGSADKTAALWDTRYTKQKLHSFEAHSDEIYCVKWAPFSETILATCSVDRRLNIWDISKIGLEQTPADAEDGPPELLFIHGGHTDKISDMAWSPNEPWMMASVADNNIIHIWQMAQMVYEDDPKEQEIRSEDLE